MATTQHGNNVTLNSSCQSFINQTISLGLKDDIIIFYL